MVASTLRTIGLDKCLPGGQGESKGSGGGGGTTQPTVSALEKRTAAELNALLSETCVSCAASLVLQAGGLTWQLTWRPLMKMTCLQGYLVCYLSLGRVYKQSSRRCHSQSCCLNRTIPRRNVVGEFNSKPLLSVQCLEVSVGRCWLNYVAWACLCCSEEQSWS